MKPSNITRKLQAVAALIALLATSLPGLAESLAASNLPACCNTVYCPVHHRQARELQKDKTICDSDGTSAVNDCSMRACDTTPNPVDGTAPFVLVAPLAVRVPADSVPTQMQAPRFFPFIVSIPLTPPPRPLPS